MRLRKEKGGRITQQVWEVLDTGGILAYKPKHLSNHSQLLLVQLLSGASSLYNNHHVHFSSTVSVS